MEYTKPWTSIEDQVDRLASRGVDVAPRAQTERLLAAVGYYRLTGYLYPYRAVGPPEGPDAGRAGGYRPGTSIRQVERIIAFDRDLRLLVMGGVERIEIAVRMQVGYVVGRRSAFSHLDATTFLPSFCQPRTDPETGWPTLPSAHTEWLQRVAERRVRSDEAFVEHFRTRYSGQMPIWALTELLELGHLARLYRGLNDDDASCIAATFGVPTKKVMASWLASVNYVRNVSAHHGRLYNRKLQNAPGRPKLGRVPLLDHLGAADTPKEYGTYSALAVIAYLLRSIDDRCGWNRHVVELLDSFPTDPVLGPTALGAPPGWRDEPLWRTT